MPRWLSILAMISLGTAVACALAIAIDILRGRRQPMWIMNIVWPVTALYAGPLGLWAYLHAGRGATRSRPMWQSAGLAATHCGSGCTLADLLTEGLILSFVPITLFGQRIFAGWVADYFAALLIGIAFQYFTIKPMRQLSVRRGLIAALKADFLSLTAWQVGMYGWMGVATFVLFRQELPKDGPVFWFMMQIAMLAGFATCYPVNWWLIRAGIKEQM